MVEIDKEALYAELDALPEMVVRSRLEKGVWPSAAIIIAAKAMLFARLARSI